MVGKGLMTGFTLMQVSLRILESRIKSYTETQLPHKLGALEQHYKNILRYQTEENWDKLNTEQINANRTVQVRTCM